MYITTDFGLIFYIMFFSLLFMWHFLLARLAANFTKAYLYGHEDALLNSHGTGSAISSYRVQFPSESIVGPGKASDLTKLFAAPVNNFIDPKWEKLITLIKDIKDINQGHKNYSMWSQIVGNFSLQWAYISLGSLSTFISGHQYTVVKGWAAINAI